MIATKSDLPLAGPKQRGSLPAATAARASLPAEPASAAYSAVLLAMSRTKRSRLFDETFTPIFLAAASCETASARKPVPGKESSPALLTHETPFLTASLLVAA